MDTDSVYNMRTPTKSELATFQVMSNQEFVDLSRPQPTTDIFNRLLRGDAVDEEDEKEEEENLELPGVTMEQNWVEEEDDEKPDEFFVSEVHSPQQPVSPPQRATPLPKQMATPLQSPQKEEEEEEQEEKYEKKSRRKKKSVDPEIEAEKEGLLAELHALERQGLFKFVRPLTMDDSLEELQFQYDRAQAELNTNQMVEMVKSGIKMGSGMVEMMMKKNGVQSVDGFHTHLCRDMNKFNRPLGRLYKKYWRKGGVSPEMELGMIFGGSLAWTIVQNKMSGKFDAPPSQAAPPPPPPPSEATPKPPTLNSLKSSNVWENSSAEDELKKKTKELEKQLEAANFAAREAERKLKESEARIAKQREEEQLDEEDEEDEEEEEEEVVSPPKRIIPMDTPKKGNSSSKKRSQTAIEL